MVSLGRSATVAWSDERKVAYVDDHNEGWAHHFGRLQGLLG